MPVPVCVPIPIPISVPVPVCVPVPEKSFYSIPYYYRKKVGLKP